MSSYKLVQYLKQYVNAEGIPTPIVIRSRTARRWLHHLGFEYKEVKKVVFVDGHDPAVTLHSRLLSSQVPRLKKSTSTLIQSRFPIIFRYSLSLEANPVIATMASSQSSKSRIILDKPEQWDGWVSFIRTTVQDPYLWGLVDPNLNKASQNSLP